jgi:hypothetical protein
MAKIKLEKILNWGTPYSPEMQSGETSKGPRWDTLRQQVRDAEADGYDSVLGVETQHDPFLALDSARRSRAISRAASGCRSRNRRSG